MAKPSSHLVHDLTTVWDEICAYKGNFAYSENRPDAPNPLLTITNIGPISLPLSEIDAKRIIASQVASGLGTSTAIDKKVRDTWQIDPSLVSFRNPAWDSFLRSNTANICSGFGLPGGYDIRYKLQKLLLDEKEETESHFRRRQDTQQEEGMFATMVIVLPSQYTGGEIIVSHGSISKVIDVSASSTTSISVLSWYTDVKHEVKPIRSGYRLVLSYNLIWYSPSGPEVMPTADNTGELSRLHEILERWRTGGYKQLPEQRMVALVLGHQYSESDLNMGQAALKGQDVHKVNQTRSVAEMLGFEMWLVKFKLYTMWYVEGNSDGEEFWIPDYRVHWTCTLEYCTDLKGNRVPGEIDRFQGLIRDSSSDNMSNPTNQEFERYPFPQDAPSSISNYYHRAALVIFNKDRVMIIACGVEYGLGKLQTSLKQDSPTTEDKKIIDLLLQDDIGRMTESNWKVLVEFPLRFHDLDLWNRIIEHAIRRCFRPLITLKEQMFLAWDMFGFQQVQSSYDAISEREYDGDAIDFIHKVRARAASLGGQEIVGAWCDKYIVAFVKGDNRAFNILDVAKTSKLLISIVKEDGIRFLKDFDPKLCDEYWGAAMLFMYEKENIYASPANEPGRNKGEDLNQIFEDFIDKCIRGAIGSLDMRGYLLSTESTCDVRKENIYHIFTVVESCITTNRVDECANLFRSMWNAGSGDALKKLMFYYIPFTIGLCVNLPLLGTNLLLPPFATFARNVIGYYLSQVLGSKTHNPQPSPQMVPCDESCSACRSLQEFLEQLYVPVQDFCPSRKTREHFIDALYELGGFISFTDIAGGRHRVVKHRKFLNSNRWEYRLKQARDFLKCIGDDGFIEQLMGNRFEDFKAALEGKSSYNYIAYE